MLCQKGETVGGPRSTPAPRPRGRGSLREPGGKGAGVLQGGGVPAAAGEGRARPGEQRRRAGQSTGLAGRAYRTSRCGEGAGAPAGEQQSQTGSEGRKKGSCATEGDGARGRGRGRGRGGARRGLSAAQDCILRQKLS